MAQKNKLTELLEDPAFTDGFDPSYGGAYPLEPSIIEDPDKKRAEEIGVMVEQQAQRRESSPYNLQGPGEVMEFDPEVNLLGTPEMVKTPNIMEAPEMIEQPEMAEPPAVKAPNQQNEPVPVGPATREDSKKKTSTAGARQPREKKKGGYWGGAAALLLGEGISNVGDVISGQGTGQRRQFYTQLWDKLNQKSGMGGMGTGTGSSTKGAKYPEYVRLFQNMPGVSEVLDTAPKVKSLTEVARSGSGGITDQALAYLVTRMITGPGIITSAEIQGTMQSEVSKLEAMGVDMASWFKKKRLPEAARKSFANFILTAYRDKLPQYDDSASRASRIVESVGLDPALVLPGREAVYRNVSTIGDTPAQTSAPIEKDEDDAMLDMADEIED